MTCTVKTAAITVAASPWPAVSGTRSPRRRPRVRASTIPTRTCGGRGGRRAFLSFASVLWCSECATPGGARVLAKVLARAAVGLEGKLVQVEVDIARQGLPNFLIVALPNDAVREARERVRAAIRNSGLVFPNRRRYRC